MSTQFPCNENQQYDGKSHARNKLRRKTLSLRFRLSVHDAQDAEKAAALFESDMCTKTTPEKTSLLVGLFMLIDLESMWADITHWIKSRLRSSEQD